MSIKNIATIKPVDMLNKEENKVYLNEDGLILVEFEDNSRRYLDIGNKVDITDYENWIPLVDEDSKMEYIFKGAVEYYS